MDGEETFLFLSNRREREPNPELSVKGSGANHYPRAPRDKTVEPIHAELIQQFMLVLLHIIFENKQISSILTVCTAHNTTGHTVGNATFFMVTVHVSIAIFTITQPD